MGDKDATKGSFGTLSSKPLLLRVSDGLVTNVYRVAVKGASGKQFSYIVTVTSSSHGVVDAFKTYHPSVSMTIQWDVDNTLANLNLGGVEYDSP